MTTPGEERVRSFIAIPVPSARIEALEETVKSLDSEIGENVRWVRPEGFHLTLKFLGDLSAGKVEHALESLPLVISLFSPF